MNKKKTKSMLIVALLLLTITIGYAVISSNLSINGTSIINKPTWDIHFENIQVKSGSITPSTAAHIVNSTGVEYAITLDTPGDYYEFNVDAKNAGTIDGMVESVTSTVNGQPISNLPGYIEYYVTYSDGTEIVPNHLLAAGEKVTYTVHIGFNKDVDSEDLPSTAENYNLNFKVIDIQATDDAQEIEPIDPNVVYTANIPDNDNFDDMVVRVDESINPAITQYQTASQAIQALKNFSPISNPTFYLKHNLNNGIVESSYIGFIVTDEMANEFGMTKGKYYITNDTSFENKVALIHSVFDSSDCSDYYGNQFCSNDAIKIYVYDNDPIVSVTDGYVECTIKPYGAYCGLAGLN